MQRIPTPAPRRLSALVLLPLLAFVACGRKEPPQPPPSRVPARIAELKLEQRGMDVMISFAYPSTTIGGLPLDDFERIEILELVRDVPDYFFEEPEADELETEGDEDDEATTEDDSDEDADDGDEDEREGDEDGEADDEAAQDGEDEDGEAEDEEDAAPRRRQFTVDAREFAAAAQVRMTLEGAELASATRGDRIFTSFRLLEIVPEENVAHALSVRVVRDEKLVSPNSSIQTIIPKNTPSAPTELEVVGESSRIEVSWRGTSDPELIEGFNVYRRAADEPGFDVALRLVPIATEEETEAEPDVEETSFEEATDPGRASSTGARSTTTATSTA